MKNKLFLLMAMALFTFSVQAQVEAPDSSSDDYGIINFAEYPPTPVNCEGVSQEELRQCFNAELQRTIKTELKLPPIFQTVTISLKVYVSFLVDTTAQVSNIEIVRGAEYALSDSLSDLADQINAEAIRVVGLFKFTKPGHLKGKPNTQRITVPINFSNTASINQE